MRERERDISWRNYERRQIERERERETNERKRMRWMVKCMM